jgi:hypothetical protein
VPDTPSYATYAKRAGARPERWRADIVDDLLVDGRLRIAPSRIEPATRGRALLVGDRFALEVGQDRLRPDAFFAYRVERVSTGREKEPIRVRAELAIEVPGRAVAGLPLVDPVAPLLSLSCCRGT